MTFLTRLSTLFHAKPSPLQQAEAQAVAHLDCQRVHAIRTLKERATINGLLTSVDDEARQRYEAKLAAVLEARGSA